MWSLFSRRDLLRFALLLLVMLGGTLLELATLGAVPLFVSLIAASPQSRPAFAGWLTDALTALRLPYADNLPFWCGILLGLLFLLRTVYLVLSYMLQERILRNRQIALATRLFTAYMNAPYAYHLQHNSASIINNVSQQTETLIKYALDSTLNIVRHSLVLLTVIALLLSYDPLVCLGTFAALGLAAGGFLGAARRKLNRIGNEMYRENSQVIRTVSEGIGAYREALILDCRKYFCDRLHQALEALCNHQKTHSVLSRSIWPFMELITCGVLLGTMAILFLTRDDTTDVAPTIALVAVCLARLKGTITEMMIFYSYRKSNQSVIDTIIGDLRELEKPPFPPPPPLPFHHNVTLRNISCRYPGQEHDTLHDLTLDIPAGASLALVGPTGSGKTTIANILTALLPATSGTIEVDGVPVNTPETIRAWQNLIGYVSQDIFLTDDTLRANIAFGLPEKNIDETALSDAVRASQLQDFIDTLPDGLATIVGERGIRLSGGQKQRIAIARALYRKPPFLVFDEATSALDVNTERAIVDALNALHGHHTIVVIAHRLSTVRNCDRLVFIKDGTPVCSGTYAELQEQLPEFQQMTQA